MRIKGKTKEALLKKYAEWSRRGRNDHRMKHLVGHLRLMGFLAKQGV